MRKDNFGVKHLPHQCPKQVRAKAASELSNSLLYVKETARQKTTLELDILLTNEEDIICEKPNSIL